MIPDHKKKISKHATQNQKISWERKRKNMKGLIDRLNPIEDQITELESKRTHLLDQVLNLRDQMIHTCIHPADQLVEYETYVECKFCNRKLAIVNDET